MSIEEPENLARKIDALQRENARQRQEIKILRDRIDLLIRRGFGKSSERLDERQLMLMLQGEEPKKDLASSQDVDGLEAELDQVDKELKSKTKSTCRSRKPRIPDHLPVSEVILIIPDEVKENREAYRHIGDEVTEQLDYTPARFSRRRIIRSKWVKRDEPYQAPIIARLDTLAERSLAAPGLLAQIIVSKYCNHLPLYRQEQHYRLGHGIDLARQSMARWVALAARWLKPIYERIHTNVMAGRYIQVDETVIDYLDPGHGKTRLGYLWTIRRPENDTVFHWRTSRAAWALEQIIPTDFSGVIGCDGYQAYHSHAAKRGGQHRLAACWAHARRKFDEAREAAPRHAAMILLLIQKLYLIEKRMRDGRLSAKLRQLERTQCSRPIVEQIGRRLRLWKSKGVYLPQSNMGRAIDYTLALWPYLQLFIEDGRVEIDNNLVENAIRPTAVSKKNWLFIGDAEAGETSAILFTLIEACRRRRIDPWAYLRDVLTRLPTMTNQQIDEVTPDRWLSARVKNEQAQHITTASRQAVA